MLSLAKGEFYTMHIETIFQEPRKLSVDNFNLLFNCCDDLSGYLFMNQIEKSIMDEHGNAFFLAHVDYIRMLIGYLLQGSTEEMYLLYAKTFDEYMRSNNNDIDKAIGFNLVFAVWIHVALKILRKYAV